MRTITLALATITLALAPGLAAGDAFANESPAVAPGPDAPALTLAQATGGAHGHGGAKARHGAVGVATAGDLAIRAAWVRGTPPGAPVAAGYLTITNSGAEPDRLLGGSAPFAARVEVHEMADADGMMTMRPIAGGLAIAPGATVTLAPGGVHVMFMGLTAAARPGDTVPVTLSFERAGEVEVEMPVSAIGAQSAGH